MTNKLLGQNWLVNPKIHEAILAAGEIGSSDTVLEVGPGTGLLTEHLVKTGARILAVEKDPKLVEILQEKFKNYKNVTIISDDILKFDHTQYKIPDKRYKLIGNIPYYLTSHLLRIALEKWPSPERLVLMIQKEVAQRIVAKPPQMSLLALSVQFYAETKIMRSVAKGNFRPTPKVDSAIIKITPRALSFEQKRLAPVLFKIARAGFEGKRKQILNSLSTNLNLPKADLENTLTQSQIDPHRRPETLNLQEWLNLSSSLSSLLLAD